MTRDEYADWCEDQGYNMHIAPYLHIDPNYYNEPDEEINWPKTETVVIGHVNPLDRQVGGNHYKDMKIQPIEYIMENGLGFCEGNIVKYITRYSQKGGIEDIDKVIHYAEILKAKLSNS